MLLEQFEYLILTICAIGAVIFAGLFVCGVGWLIGAACSYENATTKQHFTWGALAISYVFIAVNIYHWYVGFV